MARSPESKRARLLVIAEAARDMLRAKHFACSCGCATPYFQAAVRAWADYAIASGMREAEAETEAFEVMLTHSAAVENLAAERAGQTLH